MANTEQRDMPVYLFTGFLEAGKTKFIQETLEDKRFCNGEPTLLLVCEEGEEEYAPDEFAKGGVQIRVIHDQSELTTGDLLRFVKETKAERVLIEYNGMWMLDALYSAMPENWMVYQEFMFADATTFLTYNTNMRQLVYDKLKSCELVVFNRFKPDMDKMAFHKIVRGASRRADIAYEAPDGNVVYDDIQDPLPVPRHERGAQEVRGQEGPLQGQDPQAQAPAAQDLCHRPPRDDLLRGGYPVCGPGLQLGQGGYRDG